MNMYVYMYVCVRMYVFMYVCVSYELYLFTSDKDAITMVKKLGHPTSRDLLAPRFGVRLTALGKSDERLPSVIYFLCILNS